MPKKSLPLLALLSLSFLSFSSPAPAAETDVQRAIERLEKRINEQDKLIENQQRMLKEQSQAIRDQKKQISALTNNEAKRADEDKASTSSRKSATATKKDYPSHAAFAEEREHSTAKAAPIKAPPREPERPKVDALANQGGVLSPPGTLSFENTVEYTNTTRNLFAFNGVELAQVVLVGGITASSARHQIVQETGRLRLGITNRLEADVHVPFVYRNDSLTNSVTTSGTTTTSISGADLGDIDIGLAYQLNDGTEGWPFLIGNLRYKANNADGPFDVPYDSNNIATRLPTGTGFQTVEGSVTAIKVSDPAVLFANLGYVYDVPRDIDRDFNGVTIGHVNPGDAINAMAGMGFAINQQTSFSLGYKHSYVFPTYQKMTQSGSTATTSSGTSQVGALALGLSYAFTPETSVNFNVEAGLTNDAPDVHLIVRVPIKLGNIF